MGLFPTLNKFQLQLLLDRESMLRSHYGDTGELLRDHQQSTSWWEQRGGSFELPGGCSESFGNHMLNRLWSETVCFHCSSRAELSESINSIYQWYRNFTICLGNAGAPGSLKEMPASSGLVQQSCSLIELFGSQHMQFYRADWLLIEAKATLISTLSYVIKLDQAVLGGAESSGDIHTEDGMYWTVQHSSHWVDGTFHPSLGDFGVDVTTPAVTCECAPVGVDEEMCWPLTETRDEPGYRGNLDDNARTRQGASLCSGSQQSVVSSCTQGTPTKRGVDTRMSHVTTQYVNPEPIPSASPSCDAMTDLSAESDVSDESSDYEDFLFSFSLLDAQPMEMDPPFSGLVNKLTEVALDHFSIWLKGCSAAFEQSQNVEAPTHRQPIRMEDFFDHMKLKSRELTEEGDIVLIETPISKSFACPFYNHDKTQYLQCLTRNDFRTIRDLKQHIWTVHRQPYYCPTCNITFSQASLRDQHIMSRTCNTQQRNKAPQGLSENQLHNLAKRCKPGTTEITEWFQIWNLAFPQTDIWNPPEPPHTPYLTGVFELAVSVVRDYWSRTGTQIIADFLDERGLRDYDVPNEERNLSAMYHVTLDEVVDQLVCIFQENNNRVNPIHSIAATLSSIWKSWF
ncbi:hypothetical protein PG985_016323 [Apiospora marii]|uniref:uncharacterized protein n=1 Tax=Apiospora marii TaxID=335849 RepID=UPI00312F7035